jgi:murein L,D-transpeptidase YcbB/YkuD
LAKWILDVDESDWTGATVDTVLEGYERTVKTLQTPLPVHLTYESAWIDGDGQLRFAPDVYGRDLLLQQALYEGTSDAAALPAELQAGRPELPAP